MRINGLNPNCYTIIEALGDGNVGITNVDHKGRAVGLSIRKEDWKKIKKEIK